MRTETLNLVTVYGPAQVVVRPISVAHVIRVGGTSLPTMFGGGGGDISAGYEFMRIITVAGVDHVVVNGRTYRVGLEPNLEAGVLTPEDLEAPGLSGGLDNLNAIVRAILELTGMGDLFRPPGGEAADGGGATDHGANTAHDGAGVRD